MATPRPSIYSAASGGGVYAGIAGAPSWVDGLFAWSEIPGSTLAGSPAGLGSAPGDAGSPANALVAFSGITIRGDELHLVAVGGHMNSADNGVRRLRLGVNSPAWELRRASDWNGSEMLVAYYASGSPASRHTYRNVHWVPQLNRFMLLGSRYVYGNPGTSFLAVAGYDPVANAYDPAGTYADCLGAISAFDPVSGIGIGCRPNVGGQIVKWVAATDTHTQPIAAPAYLSCFAYDSDRLEWFGLAWGDGEAGGSVINSYKVDRDVTTATAITLAGAGVAAFAAATPTDCTMVYDSRVGRYFLWEGASRQLFKIVPNATATWTMTVQAISGTPPPVREYDFSRMEVTPWGLVFMPSGIGPLFHVRTF